MNTQQSTTQTKSAQWPSDFQRLLDKPEKTIEYVPFGAEDPIQLSIKIVQEDIAVRTKTGKTCSERDARKFIRLCKAQRLNPSAGDAYLVGYDNHKDGTATFSLIVAHVAFLKRAEASPEFEGMDSGIILQSQDGSLIDREGDFKLADEVLVGAWATVYRKGRKPTKRRLALDAMKPSYETPFWGPSKAPGQLVKCVESDALRSTFPTLLGGLYIQGETEWSAETFVRSGKPSDALPEPSKLVEVVAKPEPKPDESNPELQPANDQTMTEPQAQPAKKMTPQEELADFVVRECEVNFDTFINKAIEEGWVSDSSPPDSFNEMPAKDAQRLLRSKDGLKRKLKGN